MNRYADKYEAFLWAHRLKNGEYGDWVILDSETTGLDSDSEIIELAILSKFGSPLFNTRIKPTCPIELGAYEVHGISEEMLKDAPTFPEVYPKIIRAIAQRQVVIYNSAFDYGRLNYQCSLHELEMPKIYTHCAMGWYAQYYGDWHYYYGNYRWQKLPGGEHSALGDAKATYKLLHRMATPDSERVRFVGDLFPKRQIAMEWEEWRRIEIYRGWDRLLALKIGFPKLIWIEANLKCLPDGEKNDDNDDLEF